MIHTTYTSSSAGAAPRGFPAVQTGGGRWLHVLSHLDPQYGGLSAVVPQLGSFIAATGTPVRLAAFCAPEEQCPSDHAGLSPSIWPMGRIRWLRDKRLRERFRELVKASDGIHIHGIWEQSTNAAAGAARELRKPYIVSAHGMLEPWALKNKRWKKLVYAQVIEHANVRGAACLHALTQAEEENYRDFGCRGPIAVIPNGVTAPERLDPEPFLCRFPDLRGKRILLFLGRIHFKKGLDLLVRAWATLAAQFPEAKLVLAGPDSENSQVAVEELIKQFGLQERICFTGMLDQELKWSGVAAADCFILPSYSEGFSTAVLEALACGVPVIVTSHCNIPEVETYRCGWIIESKVEPLTYSLQEALQMPPQDLALVGERGRLLVRDRYSWPSVSHQMVELYKWVLNGVPPTEIHAPIQLGL